MVFIAVAGRPLQTSLSLNGKLLTFTDPCVCVVPPCSCGSVFLSQNPISFSQDNWLSPVSLREQCQRGDTHHKCFLDTTETNSLAAGNLSSCHKKKSSNIPGIKDDYNSSNLPNEKWHIRTLLYAFKELPKVQRDQQPR